MSDVVLVERRDHVAWVTMNRPEARNAQSTALIDALHETLHECDADPDVHVIVLMGAGPTFSAGHDLKELLKDEAVLALRSTPEGRFEHEQRMYVDRCLAIRDLGTPTIAAVHGACVAAGLMLATMCDLIIASDDATFANPVLRMTGAAVELLVEPWEMGVRAAKEFLFTGDTIDAAEAYRLGLVNRVVPREDLTEAAGALAAKVAAMPPVTVRLVKRSLNKTLDLMGQRDSFDYHFAIHQFAHDTATAQEALAARRAKGSMREVLAESQGDPKP